MVNGVANRNRVKIASRTVCSRNFSGSWLADMDMRVPIVTYSNNMQYHLRGRFSGLYEFMARIPLLYCSGEIGLLSTLSISNNQGSAK
jgi:hypothetical protein